MNDLVAKYLRLDRAIGHVVEFMGVKKEDMSDDDQKSLADAMTELDVANDDLQKAIYELAGVK